MTTSERAFILYFTAVCTASMLETSIFRPHFNFQLLFRNPTDILHVSTLLLGFILQRRETAKFYSRYAHLGHKEKAETPPWFPCQSFLLTFGLAALCKVIYYLFYTRTIYDVKVQVPIVTWAICVHCTWVVLRLVKWTHWLIGCRSERSLLVGFVFMAWVLAISLVGPVSGFFFYVRTVVGIIAGAMASQIKETRDKTWTGFSLFREIVTGTLLGTFLLGHVFLSLFQSYIGSSSRFSIVGLNESYMGALATIWTYAFAPVPLLVHVMKSAEKKSVVSKFIRPSNIERLFEHLGIRFLCSIFFLVEPLFHIVPTFLKKDIRMGYGGCAFLLCLVILTTCLEELQLPIELHFSDLDGNNLTSTLSVVVGVPPGHELAVSKSPQQLSPPTPTASPIGKSLQVVIPPSNVGTTD